MVAPSESFVPILLKDMEKIDVAAEWDKLDLNVSWLQSWLHDSSRLKWIAGCDVES